MKGVTKAALYTATKDKDGNRVIYALSDLLIN